MWSRRSSTSHGHRSASRILVVTAKQIMAEDRAKLSGSVRTIMEKTALRQDGLLSEVRRAMSGRKVVA